MSFKRYSDFLQNENKNVKSFDQFIVENYPSLYRNEGLYFSFGKKINLFCKHSWFAQDFVTNIDEVFALTVKELFNGIIDKEYMSNKTIVDKMLPALGFDRYMTEIAIQDGYPVELIYNHPEASVLFKKATLYKKLQEAGSQNLSKTVFSREEVFKLNFPIIAKNELSWKSKGVEKFDTLEDLGQSDAKFDLFQEAIKIDKEWRSLVFKGKDGEIRVLAVYLRTPVNSKASGLRVSESTSSLESRNSIKDNEAASFAWKHIDIWEDTSPDNPDFKQISKLIKEASDVSPNMNLYSVDFARDVDGKIWHLECNTQPGMNGLSPVLAYLAILRDHFGITMMKDDKSNLQSIIYRLVEKTKAHWPIGQYVVPVRLMTDETTWFGKKIELEEVKPEVTVTIKTESNNSENFTQDEIMILKKRTDFSEYINKSDTIQLDDPKNEGGIVYLYKDNGKYFMDYYSDEDAENLKDQEEFTKFEDLITYLDER